jgi:hypothetical protein
LIEAAMEIGEVFVIEAQPRDEWGWRFDIAGDAVVPKAPWSAGDLSPPFLRRLADGPSALRTEAAARANVPMRAGISWRLVKRAGSASFAGKAGTRR